MKTVRSSHQSGVLTIKKKTPLFLRWGFLLSLLLYIFLVFPLKGGEEKIKFF